LKFLYSKVNNLTFHRFPIVMLGQSQYLVTYNPCHNQLIMKMNMEIKGKIQLRSKTMHILQEHHNLNELAFIPMIQISTIYEHNFHLNISTSHKTYTHFGMMLLHLLTLLHQNQQLSLLYYYIQNLNLKCMTSHYICMCQMIHKYH